MYPKICILTCAVKANLTTFWHLHIRCGDQLLWFNKIHYFIFASNSVCYCASLTSNSVLSFALRFILLYFYAGVLSFFKFNSYLQPDIILINSFCGNHFLSQLIIEYISAFTRILFSQIIDYLLTHLPQAFRSAISATAS